MGTVLLLIAVAAVATHTGPWSDSLRDQPVSAVMASAYTYEGLVHDANLARSQAFVGARVQGSNGQPLHAVDLAGFARVGGLGVAAESLTPLEQGAAKVPGNWGPGLANRDLGGTRWFDPAAPTANGIRIDEAVPDSPFPSQQVDHVVVRSGGRIIGPDGKPIVGSLKENPDAHIPLSDWLNWTSWNSP